jgi:hypothetical protein
MAANKKLMPLLKGRRVVFVSHGGGEVTIGFHDKSTAVIKVTEKPTVEMQEREVKGVRQTSDVMNLDFTDGSTAQIKLAGPTASVMLRDRKKTLEYAD